MINKEILEQIGLSKNEAEIYLILLKLGEAVIYEIANYTKISRPNIYDIIKTLSEKGLVTSIIKQNKKYYRSVAPEKLTEILKEKEANLMKIIPQLNQIYISKRVKPIVEVFSGSEGLKSIMSEMSKTKKDIWIFNTISKEYTLKQIPEHLLERFLKEKEKLKTKTYSLYSKGVKPISGPEYKLKQLPGENLGCVGYWVYGDRVGIGIWTDPLIIIRIIDENVAKTYKKSIKLIWNSLK